MSLKVALVSALTVQSYEDAEEVEPAVGMLTLASLIREKFDTRFFNMNEFWTRAGRRRSELFESAVESVVASAPDVVGFGSISGSYPLTVRLAEAVAARLPDAAIVFGGPQASVVDRGTLDAFPFVNAVIRGEAEYTFPAWLDGLASGHYQETLPGLTLRKNGRVLRNPNASVVLDLDRVPLPAFDLHQGIEKLDALPIEIGRGCPFACKFCSTNDFFRRNFRLKSPQVSLAEMRALDARYGVKQFDLIHDMFTVDRKRIVEYCECMLEAGVPYNWSCSARTDSVDPPLLRLMKDAGCTGIFFGIETGSQRLQKLVNKNLNLGEARSILAAADEIGISTTASLITGYPMENKQDFTGTVDFISDTLRYPRLEAQLHILSPLAETPLATEYKEQIYLDERWFEISEDGDLQEGLDRELIAAHRDVFPNFYAFPCELDRGYLRRAGDFLTNGAIRCNGLLQAFHLLTGDMTGVIDKWEAAHPGRSSSYFQSWQFVRDLARFAEEEYGPAADAALTVCCRFYEAVAVSMETERPKASVGSSPVLTLPRRVHLIRMNGDVLAAFQSMKRGERPGPEVLEKEVCLAVRQDDRQCCTIVELPELTSAMALHAARNATVDEAIEDYRERGIQFGTLDADAVGRHVIDYLVKRGWIRVAAPVQMDGDSLKVAREIPA